LLVLVGRYGSRFRIPPEIAPLIHRIQQERGYGAVRVVLHLQSLRITNDHPEDLSSSSRWPYFMEDASSRPKAATAPLEVPGRSVQLDAKFVPRARGARQRFYQCTAIPEVTGFRVLRIYDYHHRKTAMDYFRKLGRHFPA
jgi:hypothetical protein